MGKAHLALAFHYYYASRDYGGLDDYAVPRDCYVGLIARGRGQVGRSAFETARETIIADLTRSPDTPKSLLMLGLLEAMLGWKEEARSNSGHAPDRAAMGPFARRPEIPETARLTKEGALD